MPRDSTERERERKLDGLATWALDQNVSQSSTAPIAEINIDPHNAPAPLPGAEKLSERSSRRHSRPGRASPGRVRPEFASRGRLETGPPWSQMPNEGGRLAGGGNELPYRHSITNDRPDRADGGLAQIARRNPIHILRVGNKEVWGHRIRGRLLGRALWRLLL